MKEKTYRRLKWLLGLVLVLSLCCFYPGDMIPLPLVVYETGMIDNALSSNFDWVGIGAKFTLIGQIVLLWTLIKSKVGNLRVLGGIATVLLMLGIPMMMNYVNVRGWTFEFTTWIPFFISSIAFIYFSVRVTTKKNYSQQTV